MKTRTNFAWQMNVTVCVIRRYRLKIKEMKRMPRSPLTETYEKVNDIFQTINALEPDQRNLLLDWLFPEPEPTKKPQKKSSKKSAGGGGRRQSKREVSLRQQIGGVVQGSGNSLQPRCLAMIDDNGGEMQCGETADANVHHLNTHPDYHEFQPAEQAAATSGD